MSFSTALNVALKKELQSIPLPPYLDTAVDLFQKSHRYFRTYKFYNMMNHSIKNPSNGNPAVYGAALHMAADYSSLHYPLDIALVTKCTKDLLKEYRAVSKSYKKLCQAIKWQYPVYQHVEWRQENIVSSFYYFRCQNYINQMLKIKKCSQNLIWQVFKLSMCMNDAYLLLNGDQETRYEGFTELIGKWDQYRNNLGKDKKRLIEKLKKENLLSEKILHSLDCDPATIEKFKNQINLLIEQAVEEIGDAGEKAVATVYKKGKITPLQIDFSVGKEAPPSLPKNHFPPWGGKKIKVLAIKVPAQDSLLDQASQTLATICAYILK